jgi:capsular exopolysaccharide synthesis family protein
MEKIKKALERASADKCNVLVGSGGSIKAKLNRNAELSEITYEHTKKINVQMDYLRKNRVLISNNNDPVSDAYKVLRTKVLQCMRKHNWNSLAITSPRGGDGKTITAINLAISLSKEVNQTVLLVDFDLRQPKIGEYFSSEELPGISEYLDGSKEISEILFNPCVERLVVLPGNRPFVNSSEMLSSPKMLSLVSELKNYYTSRIVIFDLPPVLSCDDVLAFSPFVDSFILVAEDEKNKKDEIKRALQLMDSDKLIGTVLNKSHVDVSVYSYS